MNPIYSSYVSPARAYTPAGYYHPWASTYNNYWGASWAPQWASPCRTVRVGAPVRICNSGVRVCEKKAECTAPCEEKAPCEETNQECNQAEEVHEETNAQAGEEAKAECTAQPVRRVVGNFVHPWGYPRHHYSYASPMRSYPGVHYASPVRYYGAGAPWRW